MPETQKFDLHPEIECKSEMTYSPVEPVVRADQDVVLVLEIVLHVCSVYPNTKADDFCMVVRSVHFFDAVPGCTSLPDALSHETWVYPSSAAASRCPVAVSVCARLGVSGLVIHGWRVGHK